jgi:hypothetical protein
MCQSSSESNLLHASPVEIKPFPEAEMCRGYLRQKIRVGAVLTDTPVKVALGAEVEACAKPVKCRRLFSGSRENSRKREQGDNV